MKISESLNQMKEELKREIIDEILDVLGDELEENFKEDFIRRVEQAERQVKEGDFSQYTPEEFKRAFS